MKLLDRGYQLLIYGGVHPNAVKEREPVDSYVSELIKEIEADALHAKKKGGAVQPSETSDDADDLKALDNRAAGAEHSITQGEASHVGREESNDRMTEHVYAAPPAAAPVAHGNVAKLNQSLLDKVAFVGAPDDYEFALAMNTVDICVFPYLEVGQSGSGPVSLAVELGKPTVVSRTKAFGSASV